VNGTSIEGWLGNYLKIDWIRTEWNILEYKVNTTITLHVRIVGERYIFIKTIIFGIYNSGLIHNETLAEDMHLYAGAPLQKTVEFTPNKTGCLILHMYASYKCHEGDQFVEQEGNFDVYGIVETVNFTRPELSSRIADLQHETNRLNASIQTLNSSYSTLEKWVYFLAVTTFVFATLLAVTVYRRKHPV